MKRHFISQFKLMRNQFLYATGLINARRIITPRSSVIILGYHALKTPDFLCKTLGITFSPADFHAQISYVARKYNVLSMESLVQGLSAKIPIPKNSVVITFDDGYQDLLDVGLPVLNKFKIPATVFITTGSMGSGQSLWTNRLYYFMAHLPETSFTIEHPETGSPIQVNSESPDKLRKSALNLSGVLKKLNETDRERIIESIASRTSLKKNADPYEELPMLTWNNVKTLSENNIEIGSHTVSHPILTFCNPEQQNWELLESRLQIEEITGKPCRYVAYPNGQPSDYSPEVCNAATESGYSAGFAFHSGIVAPGVPLFAIPRHPIFEVPLSTFALSIC